MAEKFVELEGLGISRERQMQIYATCRSYREQRQEVRETIRALCADIGGGRYGRALFEFLTTEASYMAVQQRHLVPEKTMTAMRREFYRRWEL